jgi:hypothetical protein
MHLAMISGLKKYLQTSIPPDHSDDFLPEHPGYGNDGKEIHSFTKKNRYSAYFLGIYSNESRIALKASWSFFPPLSKSM